MPKLLISTTVGTSDPTRASIPFHVATNGAAKGGVECGMVIAGDAADLMKRDVAASVRGVGIPPRRSHRRVRDRGDPLLHMKGLRGGPWGL